jgi:uncharacterized surface protein with fasciclin (FAS1) repeats
MKIFRGVLSAVWTLLSLSAVSVGAQDDSIVDIALATPNLSTLVELVVAADLVGTLGDDSFDLST